MSKQEFIQKAVLAILSNSTSFDVSWRREFSFPPIIRKSVAMADELERLGLFD